MKSSLYFICRSTGYGNFHTPIYVETDSREAEKMKNELQGLYDALRRQRHQSIHECYVASVWKVVTECDDCSRYLTTIYSRKPLYVVTDLDHRAIFYFEKDKDIMMKYHEEDLGKSWYKSEPFRLDYDEEIKNIRQMITNSKSE